jgi:hypothetical protein
MDPAILREHLAMAERHVAEGERHLLGQQERVLKLERAGHDTEQAHQLLKQFKELQLLHIADRDRLKAELGIT